MTESPLSGIRKTVRSPWAFPAILIVLLVVLVGAKISGSSIGVYEISAGKTPSQAGVSHGQVRPIRSDEWLVRTPWLMNQIENGLPSETSSGIGAHDVSVVGDLPTRTLDILVRPHHLPMWLLGPERALAAEWWTWHLLMAVGVYALLLTLTRRVGVSAACAMLLILSPSTQWWVAPGTFTTVGYGSLTAAFLLMSLDREGRIRIALQVLAGWAFACFICTLYVPWMITTALVVGLLVLGVLIQRILHTSDRRREIRNLLLGLGIVGGTAVLLTLPFAIRHFDAMQAVNQTVYPGQRAAEVGGTLSPATIFGAPFDYNAYRDQTVNINGTNQSENSSGTIYLLPVMVAVFGMSAGGIRVSRHRSSAALASTLVAGVALLSWAVLPLPSYVGRILLLDRVPPSRLPPGLAFVSVLSLGLFVGLLSELNTRLKAVTIAASIGTFAFVQLWAAGLYRVELNSVNPWKPIGCIFVLSLGLLLIYSNKGRSGLTLLVLFGVGQFWNINPLQVGAAPLLDNAVSNLVAEVNLQLGDDAGWLALGGDVYLRGSIEASGAQFVSGISRYPNHSAWGILDPTSKYEREWNRYAHVAFEAGQSGSSPVISSPQNDVVVVVVDPCDARLQKLGVDVVVTQDYELTGCGTEVAQAKWGNRLIRAYRL